MRQLTIYIDQTTEKRIRAAARHAHLSLSRWVAGLVQEKTATTWPKMAIDLAGAWPDLSTADVLRKKNPSDTRRESI